MPPYLNNKYHIGARFRELKNIFSFFMCFQKNRKKMNRFKKLGRKCQLFDFEQFSVEIFNGNVDSEKNDNEHSFIQNLY